MTSATVLKTVASPREASNGVGEGEARAAQSAVLRAVYTRADAFDRFGQTILWPPEVKILVRYHDDFVDKRVLDVGVGAGRTTNFLADLAAEYTGIDYSESMVRAATKRFPHLRIEQQNICDLSAFADASFDCVFAPSAILDALSHSDRLVALAEIHRVLASNGLFAFSGHNLAAPRSPAHPSLEFSKDPVLLARYVLRWSVEIAHWLKYRRFELRTTDYAILNDAAFEWRALHYYCTREAQIRQLESAGFRVVDCLSMDGLPNEPGRVTGHDYKLHYVCRAINPRMEPLRQETRRRHDRRAQDRRGQERRLAQRASRGV